MTRFLPVVIMPRGRLPAKRRFVPFKLQRSYFHCDTRNRRFLLRHYGKARLP